MPGFSPNHSKAKGIKTFISFVHCSLAMHPINVPKEIAVYKMPDVKCGTSPWIEKLIWVRKLNNGSTWLWDHSVALFFFAHCLLLLYCPKAPPGMRSFG